MHKVTSNRLGRFFVIGVLMIFTLIISGTVNNAKATDIFAGCLDSNTVLGHRYLPTKTVDLRLDANVGTHTSFYEEVENPPGSGNFVINEIGRQDNVNFGWYNSGLRIDGPTEVILKAEGDVSLCPWSGVEIPLTNAQVQSNTWHRFNAAIPPLSRFVIKAVRNEATGNISSFNDGENEYLAGNNVFVHIGRNTPSTGLPSGYDENLSQLENLRNTATFELNNSTNQDERFLYKYNNIVTAETTDPSTGEVNGYQRLYESDNIWNGNSGLHDVYVWFNDPEGDYSNNTITSDNNEYKIQLYHQPITCYGSNGEFLRGVVLPEGGGIPSANLPGAINFHFAAETNSSGGGGSVGPVSDEPGVWQDTINGNGYLWLKIIDDQSAIWGNNYFEPLGPNAGNGAFQPFVPGYGDNIYTRYPNNENPKDEGIGDGIYTTPGNSGGYNISIIALNNDVANQPLIDFMNDIIAEVKSNIFGAVNADGERDGGIIRDMFQAVIDNPIFGNAIKALVTLSIIFFGYMFILGFSKFTMVEFIVYMLRVAILFTLISPASWDFFYENFFSLFINGIDDLINVVSSHMADAAQFNTSFQAVGANAADANFVAASDDAVTNTFGFFNVTLSFVTSDIYMRKISALLFSSFSGFFIGIALYVALFLFMIAIFMSVLVYLSSIIVIAILLLLAPIFITFILFEKTRTMFDNWVKMLMNYFIQPVFLFTMLAIFNIIIFSFFYNFTNFNACLECWFELRIPVLDNFIEPICVGKVYKVWGYDPLYVNGKYIPQSPVSFMSLLNLFIVIALMLKFISWIVQVGASLTAGVISPGSLLDNSANTASAGLDSAKTASRPGFTAAKQGYIVSRPGIKLGLGAVKSAFGSRGAGSRGGRVRR